MTTQELNTYKSNLYNSIYIAVDNAHKFADALAGEIYDRKSSAMRDNSKIEHYVSHMVSLCDADLVTHVLEEMLSKIDYIELR